MDAALELGKIFVQSKARGSISRAKIYLLMAKSSKNISDEAREEASALIAELDGCVRNRR